jgi:hypothetical protein
VGNIHAMNQWSLIALMVLKGFLQAAQPDSTFILFSPELHPVIVVDAQEPEPVQTAAELLAQDIELVTGFRPQITSEIVDSQNPVLVIGTVTNPLLVAWPETVKDLSERLADKWEMYAYRFISSSGRFKSMIICGSDPRGTAYGVLDLSRKIGVSPWSWWADVHPAHQELLILSAHDFTSKTPSVKYRGIFLNDEDWGLHPWAADTFEPETGDIGPKTYAKIFELLLRLKANLIWPAMHPCTKAFFHYPGNPAMAKKYGLIIGSSHAEPMLRNNVDEWDPEDRGNFNYYTNRKEVIQYWKKRIEESRSLEAVYTLGMRGIHDSGMEGYDNLDSKTRAMENIITEQRRLLSDVYPEMANVPQVFTPYKEVLEIYDHGLNLPDDITIIWTDDNYGYIRRLSNPYERQRSGGSGIYYHISYWGRPHDYLWLSSTHPVLIWEEMTRAYQYQARRLWVVNVGDIKPAEYNTQLFLDMAYDIDAFRSSSDVWDHHTRWAESLAQGYGEAITELFKQYYHLCFERRPEFMGWNQVEYKTLISESEFNHWAFADEAAKRLDDFQRIAEKVKQIGRANQNRYDAFFQCVEYPVRCAYRMNAKFLHMEKAILYARQNRCSANEYAMKSRADYDTIVGLTLRYNEIADGKWRDIMSMAPRDLPVFEMPPEPRWTMAEQSGFCITHEGFTDQAYQNNAAWPLPEFYEGQNISHFVDVYLKGPGPVEWHATVSSPWIKISSAKGVLFDQNGHRELRIWISIDWETVPKNRMNNGEVIFSGMNHRYRVSVKANRLPEMVSSESVFFEWNNKVSIWAEHPSRRSQNGWKIIDGLGYTEAVLAADWTMWADNGSSVAKVTAEYDFYSNHAGKCVVRIICLPNHSVHGLKLAVQMDGLDPKILDFQTVGRNDRWKQNVLRNQATQRAEFFLREAGRHSLTLQVLSPALMIDRIEIDFGKSPDAYSTVSETRLQAD